MSTIKFSQKEINKYYEEMLNIKNIFDMDLVELQKNIKKIINKMIRANSNKNINDKQKNQIEQVFKKKFIIDKRKQSKKKLKDNKLINDTPKNKVKKKSSIVATPVKKRVNRKRVVNTPAPVQTPSPVVKPTPVVTPIKLPPKVPIKLPPKIPIKLPPKIPIKLPPPIKKPVIKLPTKPLVLKK